jgi:AcrR family transcriptional regulator
VITGGALSDRVRAMPRRHGELGGPRVVGSPRRAAGSRNVLGGRPSGSQAAGGSAGPRSGFDELSFAREQVDEIQRSRVLKALCEVVAERGAAGATVAYVVARAGVSRRTFYELFADREECFLAAFDQAVERAAARAVPAFEDAGRWRERIRGALVALLGFFDEEPDQGALCVVHALGAGPRALEGRAEVVRVLVAAVEEGRGEAMRGEVAPLSGEGVVGAVLAVLHTRLSERGRGSVRNGAPLTSLASPLMGMIVLPYLGSAAAARELARPAPKVTAARPDVREDPLKGLDMRLTYRTVRVLLAIAATPGASNRQVGDAAGIADQGQTSKLLQRLMHLGLTANAGAGDLGRGRPNAWRLTLRGEQLQRTIQAQAHADGPAHGDGPHGDGPTHGDRPERADGPASVGDVR